jgi:hypothetical protein
MVITYIFLHVILGSISLVFIRAFFIVLIARLLVLSLILFSLYEAALRGQHSELGYTRHYLGTLSISCFLYM